VWREGVGRSKEETSSVVWPWVSESERGSRPRALSLLFHSLSFPRATAPACVNRGYSKDHHTRIHHTHISCPPPPIFHSSWHTHGAASTLFPLPFSVCDGSARLAQPPRPGGLRPGGPGRDGAAGRPARSPGPGEARVFGPAARAGERQIGSAGRWRAGQRRARKKTNACASGFGGVGAHRAPAPAPFLPSYRYLEVQHEATHTRTDAQHSDLSLHPPFQPPSPTSRAEVATLNPQTPLGRLRLDAGDAAQVCLLSDELRLDEVAALVCLVSAQDEVRRGRESGGALCSLMLSHLFHPAPTLLTTLFVSPL
jgi:hypothetical protein